MKKEFNTIKRDGKIYLLGYTGPEKEVIIPSNIDGLPVFIVADYRNQYPNAETIVIERGVESIGERSFYGCEKLKKVTLPDTIIKIDNLAFGYCLDLECVELTEGVIEIGDAAFAGCSSLKSINLPTSLCSIGSLAFSSTQLQEITIPPKIKKIKNGTFMLCKELISCKAEQIEVISSSAFEGTESLKSIYLPNAKAVFERAFSSSKIEKVYLPENIEYISPEAFNSSKANIYYT